MNYREITSDYNSLLASSIYRTYSPSAAVDNNLTTYWWASSFAPQWIGIKFNNPYCITKISLYQSSGVAHPFNFKVQYSDDGTNYNDIGSFTMPLVTTYEDFIINNTKTHYYYRIYITNYSSDWVQLGEMKFYVNVNKFLIQDGSNLNNTDGDILSNVGSIPYTTDQFITYGMDGLFLINSNVINKINNQKYNIAMRK